LNNLSTKSQLDVGQRLKLDFSRVNRREFEEKRLAYHKNVQDRFFKQFHVVKTETLTLKKGDSAWLLAQRYRVPMWLLRQYNSTLDFNFVGTGTTLTVPQVKKQPN